MNKETLARMSAQELDEYGAAIGIVMAPAETVEEKIALIQSKRDECAVVRVMGLELSIQRRKFYDKRISDILEKQNPSDEETYIAMEMLFGKKQMNEIVQACTDEDGAIDSIALGMVFYKALTSSELKNF